MDLYKLPTNKERALILREAFYFTGKKCLRGHLSVRYASSGNCMQCIEEKRGVVFSNRRNNKLMRSPENQQLAIAAWEKGESIFTAKNACVHGHYERFITTNNCVQCDKLITQVNKDSKKWARFKKIYNLQKEEFFALLVKQDNKCAICLIELNNKNQHIDHCHATNKVRGILCSRCNQGLGLFSENKEKLQNAIKYLERHNVSA